MRFSAMEGGREIAWKDALDVVCFPDGGFGVFGLAIPGYYRKILQQAFVSLYWCRLAVSVWAAAFFCRRHFLYGFCGLAFGLDI